MILGPGTELKRLLRRFGIVEVGGCNCKDRAKNMDELGPDWCKENIEIVVDWLEETAKKRKLPFMRIGAKILVRKAIKNARRKAKFLT